MRSKLSYQEKALIAMARISQEKNSLDQEEEEKGCSHGYDFSASFTPKGNLLAKPWEYLDGKKQYHEMIIITRDKILCEDKGLASELERKIKELFD